MTHDIIQQTADALASIDPDTGKERYDRAQLLIAVQEAAQKIATAAGRARAFAAVQTDLWEPDHRGRWWLRTRVDNNGIALIEMRLADERTNEWSTGRRSRFNVIDDGPVLPRAVLVAAAMAIVPLANAVAEKARNIRKETETALRTVASTTPTPPEDQ